MVKGAWNYKHFIYSSIKAEINGRYTRSRLGGAWMILHPLAQSLVLTYGGAYSFDAFEDQQNWFIGLNQYDQWSPAVDDNFVYAYTGSYNPRLSVIDRQTGIETFSIPDQNLSWNGWSMRVAPVIGEQQNIVAAHDNRLINFDLQSRSISYELVDKYQKQPAVAVGMIYAINNGQLEAIKEFDGSLLWIWTGSSNLTSNIIVTLSHIFVSDSINTYAINIATHQLDWQMVGAGDLALTDNSILLIKTSSREIIAIDVSNDADNDGIPDWWKQKNGLLANNTNDAQEDFDNDGASNAQEYLSGTDIYNPDMDGDGALDGNDTLPFNAYKNNQVNDLNNDDSVGVLLRHDINHQWYQYSLDQNLNIYAESSVDYPLDNN